MSPIHLVFLVLALSMPASTWALNSLPFMKDSFLNLKEDLSEAKSNKKTLMVLYEQEGCPYCTEMHKTTFTDPEIVALLKNKFDLVQLDIWGGREIIDLKGVAHTEKEWARKLGIQFSPMVMFFDAGGNEVFRMPGYYKPAVFKSALHYVAEGKYKAVPFRDYANQHAVPATADTKIGQAAPSPGNLQTRLATLAKSNKGVALLFEQASCDECTDFRNQALKRQDIANTLGSHYDIVAIDMRGKNTLVDFDGVPRSEQQLAVKYSIQTAPTMVFIGPQGQEVLRHNSYLKPEHFLTLLTYITTDARLKHKSFQDWLRVKDVPQRKINNQGSKGGTTGTAKQNPNYRVNRGYLSNL